MSSSVEDYVIYQVANAPLRNYPYPHLYIEGVFPADFYSQLRANWPESEMLTSLADSGRVTKGAYAERFVLPFTPSKIGTLPEHRRAFWNDFGSWFMADRFRESIINKFQPHVLQRFRDNIDNCHFETDSLLVRDRTNYSIGPHTDSPQRLLSLLFYCPDDDRIKHLGTSIYVPLDPAFRSKGGPHHSFKRFRKVITMEYKPNSLFAFFKTDNSFHGVEPITDEHIQRDVLLYDIQVSVGKTGLTTPVRTKSILLNTLQRLFARR